MLLAIFLVAVGLRSLTLAQSADNPLLYSLDLDEAYYLDLGRRIAAGAWWGEDRAFFMDPLYGYLLGGVFRLLGDNLTIVRLLQIVLDASNVLLLAAVGNRLGWRRAGLLAAGLYALYKPAFIHPLFLLKTTLSVHGLLVFLLLALKTVAENRKPHWLGLGILAGLLALLRANLILVLPLTVLAGLLLERPLDRRRLAGLALLVAGCLAVLAVSGGRNLWQGGEFVALTTQGGRLFFSSNNASNTSGRYGVPAFAGLTPERAETDFQEEAERRTGQAMTPGEVSRYWLAMALRDLTGQPSVVPVLLANKLRHSVADFEVPVNQSFEVAARFAAVLRWPLPTFAIAFAGGVPGLFLGCRRQPRTAWLLVPVAVALGTSLLFYASGQFRLPAVPALLLGTGISLDLLAHWLQERRWLPAAVLTAAGLGLLALSLGLGRPAPTIFEEILLARGYWGLHDLDRTRTIATRASATYPDRAEMPILLGLIALAEGDPQAAIRHNQEALRRDPRSDTAWHHLGVALLDNGQPAAAYPALQQALHLRPDGKKLYNLGRTLAALGQAQAAGEAFRRSFALLRGGDPLRPEVEAALLALEAQSKAQYDTGGQ
ncbi:MAG: glycosyltransferase family 39 protein [Thermodesulfobacteriota bacterium]